MKEDGKLKEKIDWLKKSTHKGGRKATRYISKRRRFDAKKIINKYLEDSDDV